jgi:hypothetical protein
LAQLSESLMHLKLGFSKQMLIEIETGVTGFDVHACRSRSCETYCPFSVEWNGFYDAMQNNQARTMDEDNRSQLKEYWLTSPAVRTDINIA